MKYQITCDNCGTQFIIDAEPGMTVECQCPECHGVMQITLPNAAKGEHYEAPRPTGGGPKNPWHAATVDEDDRPNRRWLWIGVAVVVLVVAVIGFAMFSTSSCLPIPFLMRNRGWTTNRKRRLTRSSSSPNSPKWKRRCPRR